MPNCHKCGEEIASGCMYCSSCEKQLISTTGSTTSIKNKHPKLIPSLIILIVLFIVATAVYFLFPFSSRQLTVPGRYTTIQEAIDAAKDGTTIIVEPGVYRENIDFKGKNITLQSSDPNDPETVASTIIDGGGNGSVVVFKNGENAEAVLSGFTITNGSGTWEMLESEANGEKLKVEGFLGGGILILNVSSPTITNNIILHNNCAETGGGGGIAVWNASASIKGNKIILNRAENGGGIYIGGNSYALINNNTVGDNSALNGGGIYVGVNSTAFLEENIISSNKIELTGMP